MLTNDSKWLQPALNTLALVDPATASRIAHSPTRITVVDGPDDLIPELDRGLGFGDVLDLIQSVGNSYGVTVRPFKDKPFLLDGDIWLNRGAIIDEAAHQGVTVEQYAAYVLAHEWRHAEGEDEPPAYDAGTKFALALGMPGVARLSEEGKAEFAGRVPSYA